MIEALIDHIPLAPQCPIDPEPLAFHHRLNGHNNYKIQQTKMFNMKCVTIGDGNVGKTSALISFATNNFPEDYCPTVFDNYCVHLSYDGKPVALGLWDTAGQEEYDRLRPLSYPGTDVFLMCFSVMNRNSFDNVKHRWIPEVRHFAPNEKIFIVGTKIDMREDQNVVNQLYSTYGDKPVSYEEGLEYAKEMGAFRYMEISAKTQRGLKALFDEVIKSTMNKDVKKR